MLATLATAFACAGDWRGPTIAPVATVTVDPPADSTGVGTKKKFTAVARDSSGKVVNVGVVWTSSDTSVARVDSAGNVTAVRPGATAIRVVAGPVADSAMLRVLVPVVSVTIAPVRDTLVIGKTLQLVATARDPVGNDVEGRATTWATSNAAIASVSSQGLVTAIAPGDASITVTVEGVSGTATITARLVPVASVTVTPASATLPAGASVPFKATPRDSAGNALSGRTIRWTASNASASVGTSGLVVGAAAGTDTVIALVEGKSGSAVVTVTPPPPTRAGWYASAAGSSGAAGGIASPWDLATALAGAGGKVQPGDTIWVRGGSYVGSFRITASGTAGKPVVVRQVPGERAIIDGMGTPEGTSILWVGGDWVEVWDLELTDSDPQRSASSTLHDVRPDMIANYASHTRYVDLVVHDGGVGFYNDAQQSDVEINGSILFNIGWQGPDRGHGHAIYLRSNTGPVLARDNVAFNQFGYGIHAYVDPGEQLDNISLIGNVSFNNGTLSSIGASDNILLGGLDRATGDVVQDNLTYFSPAVGDTNMQIGYGATANGTVTVQGNHVIGGAHPLWIGQWDAVTLAGNIVTGIGFVLPIAPEVFVRPSTRQSGRAIVAVYNWTGAGSVSADLSGALRAGDPYVVRNVQDLFGSPVASGTYGGPLTLPLAAVTPPVPVGFGSSRAPATGTAFAVFVVTRQ